MKKILLLLFTLLFIFTLSACADDVPTQDAFDALETTVGDLDTTVTGNDEALTLALGDLEDELAVLEASLDTVEGDVTVIEAAIVEIRASITAIEALMNPEVPMIAANDKTTEIFFAHTNDVHGRVNDDSWAGSIGMASIKNLVDALEAQHGDIYLIDAGDMFHGTTYATLEEGASVVSVMNEVGYDLMVPGNHDFDYGQDRLLELQDMADFPMVTANIQYDADDSDYMEPYVIEDFDGVRIGFFGITSPETVYKTHPDNVIGLNFLDPIVQAELMVAELEPMVDLIIMVAHVGLDADTIITTEDIATAVPGIDVIIDGHSHSTLPDGMMVGDTLIVSTGEYMKNLGTFSLNVVDGAIASYEVALYDADAVEELGWGYDWAIQSYIDAIVEAQAVILDEIVGQTGLTLMGERNYVRSGETTLGNLIADSMIVATGADVAITNGGGIRASIPEGDVTLGDIITVLPFGNIIVTIEVTGQELLDSLEYGTSSYPSASGKFPHIAGMTFEIDYTAAAGSRVINLMIDGVAVDLTATYVVATNDFLAAGGDGYDIFATKARIGEFMGLHEALVEMFTVGTDIALPVMGRITVVNYMDVFFSEYIEGSSNNKAIELYNPTDTAIVMDGYVINYYNNGSGDPTKTYDLAGITIAAGGTYVICTDSYAGPAICDEIQAYGDDDSVVFFNGDDAMELMKDGIPIDTIGLVGQEGDDGAAWVVGTGETNEFTLVRAASVFGPSRLFNPAEWVVLPQDTFTELGSHTTD